MLFLHKNYQCQVVVFQTNIRCFANKCMVVIYSRRRNDPRQSDRYVLNEITYKIKRKI